MLYPWRCMSLLFAVVTLLACYGDCSSQLWPSKLGSSEIEVVWQFRRGEIDGDSAARKVSQRNRFLSAIYGAVGFAAVGGVMGGVSSGGAAAIPAMVIGGVIGAIAGAIDPLGTGESVAHFNMNGEDSTVSKYKLMQVFFSGSPDDAVKSSYGFFDCGSHETADELNRALARTRVKNCETDKNEARCELTEYHFEMIRAYRN